MHDGPVSETQVEDIIDTGATLQRVVERLTEAGAASDKVPFCNLQHRRCRIPRLMTSSTIDTGATLKRVAERLTEAGAVSIKVHTALRVAAGNMLYEHASSPVRSAY